LDVTYSNYANCLREMNNYLQAEKYYQKCINLRITKFGKDYYKLSTVYKAYGKLKIKTRDYNQGLYLYNKALKSYRNNYGERHPYTAEMYEIFGDYYFEQNNYKKALTFYQKSLIANSNSFNSTDIFNNPRTKDLFSEIQLLNSLKKKSETLLAIVADLKNVKEKENILKLSIASLELALGLTQSVRQGYISSESKL